MEILRIDPHFNNPVVITAEMPAIYEHWLRSFGKNFAALVDEVVITKGKVGMNINVKV